MRALNGRAGFVTEGPNRYNEIKVRWDDDGELSSKLSDSSDLEMEVTVGREDFVAACAEQPREQ